MYMLPLRERLWGCLSHVPTITIIWTIYLAYCAYHGSCTHISLFNLRSIPITPLVLTFLSVPLTLIIMRLQKYSFFAYQNAQEVLKFNIWLLKGYAVALIIAIIGIFFEIIPISYIACILALFISSLSLVQAIIGISTALRGGIYSYWYPGK